MNIINKYNKVTERLWATASVRLILIYAVLELLTGLSLYFSI